MMMTVIRPPSLHPFLTVIPLLREALLHVLNMVNMVNMVLMNMLMILIKLKKL